MIRPYLPLNGLRAFEAAARHLSFTRAAIELCVTPPALSHQVKALEERLGVPLFRRLPRGLALTDEGQALLPVLREAFDRVAAALDEFGDGKGREVLSVGAVGTFALGWLLPRLDAFGAEHPFVDLRLTTNNNRVDIAEEGLDFAIRFGDGAWHGTDAALLFEAPLTPLCSPEIAARLREPADLPRETLLRSYRVGEWAGLARGGRGPDPAADRPGLRQRRDDDRGRPRRPRGCARAGLHVRARAGRGPGGAAVPAGGRDGRLLADQPQVAKADPGNGRLPLLDPRRFRSRADPLPLFAGEEGPKPEAWEERVLLTLRKRPSPPTASRWAPPLP